MAALILVMGMSLARLPLSAAAERRGSTVEVMLIGGGRITGELLAVKSDALLIYDRSACQGKHIDLRQVAQVKVMKKPRALLGFVIGLGLGLATVTINVKNNYEYAGLAYLLITPPAALLGGAIGGIVSMPEKFSLPGESSRSLRQNLARLERFAREPDLERPVEPLFAEGMAFNDQTKNHEAKRLRQFRHRFRLLWSPGKLKISGNRDFHGEKGSFRFVNEITSKVTADYPFKLDSAFHVSSAQWRVGLARLEYELTPHFSSSLEFNPLGELTGWIRGHFSYDSIDYAMQCESTHYIHNEYSFHSLLLGLNWKPFTPSFARKHCIELGIAAGPAQVQVKYRHNLNSYLKFKDSTWSCKVHAAYDYFQTEDFSLGIFAEYQHLRASFASATFSGEMVSFTLKRDSYIYGFSRRTDVTFPGYNIQLQGLAYGLRIGLRF